MIAGISVLPFGCEPIYSRLPPLAIFLRPFQGQSPRTCPAWPLPRPKAMTCPISKRFLVHFCVNSPSSSRFVSPSCRVQIIWQSRGVHPLSRNGKHVSKKFPQLFVALKDALPLRTAVDGELVAFDESGHPSFDVGRVSASRFHFYSFLIIGLTRFPADAKFSPSGSTSPGSALHHLAFS